MVRTISVAVFALSIVTPALGMAPAPMVYQPDAMVTQIAAACGAGRTRINGVCVARTTVRQTRRAVRRCATGMTC
ncbi:hypothetical protein C7G42_07170 [Bradyrhizobium sp. MOS003]|nr:hypothetical protein C7G42_07170 [Bradyrhizobium sp. MOS003]